MSFSAEIFFGEKFVLLGFLETILRLSVNANAAVLARSFFSRLVLLMI